MCHFLHIRIHNTWALSVILHLKMARVGSLVSTIFVLLLLLVATGMSVFKIILHPKSNSLIISNNSQDLTLTCCATPFFFFFCGLWEEMGPMGAEARTCDSQSNRFKGLCVSDTNCANVCQGEGFPGGHCRGFRQRCFCTKPCWSKIHITLCMLGIWWICHLSSLYVIVWQ